MSRPSAARRTAFVVSSIVAPRSASALIVALLMCVLLTTSLTGCRRRRGVPPPNTATMLAPSARITEAEAQRQTLARCATDPSVVPRIAIRFVLSPDGGVADAAIVSPDGVDPQTASCVLRTVAAFGFPSYANGVATLEYELTSTAAAGSAGPPPDAALAPPTEGTAVGEGGEPTAGGEAAAGGGGLAQPSSAPVAPSSAR